MGSTIAMSVEDYLKTPYSPDCDYVDGLIEERNLGELPHSRLQMAIGAYLYGRRKQLGICVIPEQRVQTKPTRFRIPDLCVTIGNPPPEARILRTAPFLCIEILSDEDRLERVETRIREYLAMGVRYVWLIDPVSHAAWCYTEQAKEPVLDGVLRTQDPEILAPLAEIFEAAEER